MILTPLELYPYKSLFLPLISTIALSIINISAIQYSSALFFIRDLNAIQSAINDTIIQLGDQSLGAQSMVVMVGYCLINIVS